MSKPLPKPDWIKVRLGGGDACARLRRIVRGGGLHTVCEEAMCPNQGLCWEHGRATLMILGDTCTRGCTFCNVASRVPGAVDADEPARVAEAVSRMGLKDVVITSVTRDDLPDGGAATWADTVRRVHAAVPGIRVEVLVPDFGGSADALQTVMASGPELLGHNLETVPSRYAAVRPAADFDRSLELLRRAHAAGRVTKTSLMLGLGETRHEVLATMQAARDTGCDVFFLGQYLRPSEGHIAVERYVEPAEFDAFRDDGLAMGFRVVVSAPLVRSSYYADEQDAFLREVCGS